MAPEMDPGTGIWILSSATALMFVLGMALSFRHHHVWAGAFGLAVIVGLICIRAIWVTHY